MVRSGLMDSMNFFQRVIKEIIIKSYEGRAARPEFVKQSYKNIDLSIFYAFKMYQGTQARITRSLEICLNDHFLKFMTVVIVEVLSFVALLGLIAWLYFEEKKKSSFVCGILFLIPGRVVKATKQMMKEFSLIAELES